MGTIRNLIDRVKKAFSPDEEVHDCWPEGPLTIVKKSSVENKEHPQQKYFLIPSFFVCDSKATVDVAFNGTLECFHFLEHVEFEKVRKAYDETPFIFSVEMDEWDEVFKSNFISGKFRINVPEFRNSEWYSFWERLKFFEPYLLDKEDTWLRVAEVFAKSWNHLQLFYAKVVKKGNKKSITLEKYFLLLNTIEKYQNYICSADLVQEHVKRHARALARMISLYLFPRRYNLETEQLRVEFFFLKDRSIVLPPFFQKLDDYWINNLMILILLDRTASSYMSKYVDNSLASSKPLIQSICPIRYSFFTIQYLEIITDLEIDKNIEVYESVYSWSWEKWIQTFISLLTEPKVLRLLKIVERVQKRAKLLLESVTGNFYDEYTNIPDIVDTLVDSRTVSVDTDLDTLEKYLGYRITSIIQILSGNTSPGCAGISLPYKSNLSKFVLAHFDRSKRTDDILKVHGTIKNLLSGSYDPIQVDAFIGSINEANYGSSLSAPLLCLLITYAAVTGIVEANEKRIMHCLERLFSSRNIMTSTDILVCCEEMCAHLKDKSQTVINQASKIMRHVDRRIVEEEECLMMFEHGHAQYISVEHETIAAAHVFKNYVAANFDHSNNINEALRTFGCYLNEQLKVRQIFYSTKAMRKEHGIEILESLKNYSNETKNQVKGLYLEEDWNNYYVTYLIKKTIGGRYEFSTIKKVCALLGEGGQATVHLVNVADFVTPVIYKEFNIAYEVGAEMSTLMTMQSHAHIVRLFGLVVDVNNMRGTLMEYCEDGSLDKIVSDKKYRYGNIEILCWMAQAASGLNFLHRNQIIHRDIKPANMLLSHNFSYLKLGDMSLCKATLEGYETQLTRAGRGTFGYNAWEVEEEPTYSFSADVFSLGRSFWNLIFRKHPTDLVVLKSVLIPVLKSDLEKKYMEDCEKSYQSILESNNRTIQSVQEEYEREKDAYPEVSIETLKRIFLMTARESEYRPKMDFLCKSFQDKYDQAAENSAFNVKDDSSEKVKLEDKWQQVNEANFPKSLIRRNSW